MKQVKLVFVLLLAFGVMSTQAQEKKIKFNKGTLRICSSKNFQITGYDGDEVIIKSLHEKRNDRFPNITSTSKAYGYSSSQSGLPKLSKEESTTVIGSTVYFFDNEDRKKGLKKLGKVNENAELGIYFRIEKKDGDLIFRDMEPSSSGRLVVYGNESYEVKIPNNLKLIWETNRCDSSKRSSRSRVFYNTNPSSLQTFEGEVEIKSTLSNMKLTDVSGPVTINTLGGNVTVEFDKKKPQKLYSIYSNNGFIDIQIPKGSSLNLEASGKAVYSDVDFEILEELELDDFGHKKTKMKLKLSSGKSKMKLDAGYGTIYLRKK